ncbi:hypothetical protein FGO68_gene2162 [Halteria grandinella]|uniref:Uncharacterized protein n=1 Tax=Halteria grandinella TaxID=5974 RepID=A0A8J8N9T6_HALGN|nr:hypothetical protein FGO68_gene2162 [Halteria grandinella]
MGLHAFVAMIKEIIRNLIDMYYFVLLKLSQDVDKLKRKTFQQYSNSYSRIRYMYLLLSDQITELPRLIFRYIQLFVFDRQKQITTKHNYFAYFRGQWALFEKSVWL